jgi:microcompartment protein CcmK/EutM
MEPINSWRLNEVLENHRNSANAGHVMFVAKVIGSVVSTEKVAAMRGQKLLIVEPYRLDSNRDKLTTTGRSFIAVDNLGAGVDDFVLIVQGSSARITPETQKLPIDCVVIGIVDSVNVERNSVYSRTEEASDEASSKANA